MKTFARLGCAALICTSLAAAAQAGTVEVSYDPAATYTDAGDGPGQREATLAELAAHLKGLGARRPGGSPVLRVQLLDVDLAGTVRPVGRTGQQQRIVRGGADWPHVRLSWTLLEGEGELRRGEETLSDLNYTWRGTAYGGSSSDALRYEKRLLSDWFEARFLSPNAQAQ
jgi:hypothetical protein